MAVAENVRESITHHQAAERSGATNVAAEAHVLPIASGGAKLDWEGLRRGIVIGINNGGGNSGGLCGIGLRRGRNGHGVGGREKCWWVIDAVGVNESEIGVAAWHTVYAPRYRSA